MNNMIGKKFVISGMVIEVISDESERYKTLNNTTRETVYFDKKFLIDAVKLGKAEEVPSSDDKE